MIRYSCFFALAMVLLFSACAKIDDPDPAEDALALSWPEIADKSTQSLITQFWNEEGYFNYGSNASDLTFHYWPNAHAMDVLIDAYQRTQNKAYMAYFDTWFAGVKVKNGNTYYNNFYDDMEWNALTMLRLYEVTKDEKYLAVVVDLWRDIIAAWTEQYAGGGISWAKDMMYSKNACSNGPASILAARLYKVTQDKQYLDWALKIYNWQKDVLFNRATGAVYDNINGKTDVVNTVALTYNQGTFLGTAVELFDITGDLLYIHDGQKIANFTITKCIDASRNVLRNEGTGDNGLFKGIFIRYFVLFLKKEGIHPDYRKKFENFLKNNAKLAWREGTIPQLLRFGPSWTEPMVGETQLTSQASAAMLFEGIANYMK